MKLPLSGILSPCQEKEATKGFTLVELIVVITILAILGTIAFITLQGYSKDARDSVRITDIKSAETGLELFQLNAGKYPEPDNVVSYTGGTSEIKQGILGEGVVRNIRLDKILEDPLTNKNYVYSIFGKGLYYQIAADSENTETSFIQATYAAEPVTSIVRGNYKFDPTLPSLILVPSSVIGSGIFDPNVCFVVDGGKNTLNNCVEKKSEMSLKDFDSSLQGYWSFDETGFTVENHKYGGTNFFKDYSGNGNHAFNSGAIQGAGFVPPTQTLGYVGSGMYFTSGSLILGYRPDFKFENSFTVTAIIKLNEFIEGKIPPRIFEGDSFAVWISKGGGDTGIPALDINSSEGFLHGNVRPRSSTGLLLLPNGFPGNSDKIYNFKSDFVFISYKFNKDRIEAFVNGNKVGTSILEGFEWSKRIEGTLSYINIVLGGNFGSRTRDFFGIIDDAKIYNRTLSDDEILQQARIAGF